jgi:drug/metabolite transporter (DMT)-like permease
LLMLSTPIVITIVAFFFLKEMLSVGRIAGLLLGIGGAAVLILAKEKSGSGSNVLLGDLFIITNAISYSFYFVLVKPLILKYTPLQVITWVFTMGSLFIIPVGWQEFVIIPWATFTIMNFAAIAFVVLGATFLAYLFNIYGLHHLNASATGAYIYLQPIFATAVAMIFLDEPFTWLKGISAIMIFAGVYLVNNKRHFK